MPNEDYNANFDELVRINLKKIFDRNPQSMALNDFEGLSGEPYVHNEELVRDLEELHFIETEYEDRVYFLTERGYDFLEQQGLDGSNEATVSASSKKKSKFFEIILVGFGVLALLYAANLYIEMKNNSDEVIPVEESESKEK